jgi:hypothetical protein
LAPDPLINVRFRGCGTKKPWHFAEAQIGPLEEHYFFVGRSLSACSASFIQIWAISSSEPFIVSSWI